MTMLDTILSTKRAEVAARKGARSRFDLDAAIARQTPPRGFRSALRAAPGRAVIGEIKRASPSKGAIRADAAWDPPAHARALQAGGAACLSVLTDETFFRGADAFLVAAREATSLPVLRKDFTVDPWQAHEARAIGADAILLIVAALDDGALHEIEGAALDHCMDVLVEVRDEGELERALRLKSRLIGCNNRDLADFSVDPARAERLRALAPADCTFVGESGYATRADLDRAVAHGVRAFLIGEALMREDDIAAATRALVA